MESETLKYKPDWPQVKERCRAFWEREIVDRACVSIGVRRRVQVAEPIPRDTEQLLTDVDFLLAQQRASLENTYCAGDTIPGRNFQIGWLALGGQPVFSSLDEATVWMQPAIRDWQETPYRFDPQNPWYLRYKELYRRLWADCQGQYVPDGPGIHSPMEQLGQLRGFEPLCIDLIENPGAVHATLATLLKHYFDLQAWRYELIDAEHQGSKSWGIWSPGKHSYISSDVSAVFGPRHFREFVMPELEAITRWLDHSLFHLDGDACIKHLPALLELDRLDCVQFTPGAAGMETVGAPGTLAYLDLYKRIQRAGKCVWLSAHPEDVETLLKELDPRGIWIKVRGVESEEEADALVKNVERWSCRGVYRGWST